MNIIEQFTLSKTGELDDNEDRIVVTEHFATVIDGMTPKDCSLYGGLSSAQIAIDLIAQEIRAFPADINCLQGINRLTRRLKNYYIHHQIAEEVASRPFKRLGASLIVYSKLRKEIWMVGDCHCLIDGVRFSNEKMIDHFIANMRSKLIEQYLKRYSLSELLEFDRSREDIIPFLIQQYDFQNNNDDSPLSYAVLDGFPIHEPKIVKRGIPDAKQIVLASDGYPMLQEHLVETELLAAGTAGAGSALLSDSQIDQRLKERERIV
ncbi:hypothetical protein LJK87_01070 [Paenibacillus sp. P25]|nr:hypothetical protein LJK87_01070 [Paenibacillus sp. P25]